MDKIQIGTKLPMKSIPSSNFSNDSNTNGPYIWKLNLAKMLT